MIPPEQPYYFYPRSPCGERPVSSALELPAGLISIHALLAESDIFGLFCFLKNSDFYPRSPCGERHSCPSRSIGLVIFLSTLSLRRATLIPACQYKTWCYFYPRSPCGERRDTIAGISASGNFYPRSPCGERHLPEFQ